MSFMRDQNKLSLCVVSLSPLVQSGSRYNSLPVDDLLYNVDAANDDVVVVVDADDDDVVVAVVDDAENDASCCLWAEVDDV